MTIRDLAASTYSAPDAFLCAVLWLVVLGIVVAAAWPSGKGKR